MLHRLSTVEADARSTTASDTGDEPGERELQAEGKEDHPSKASCKRSSPDEGAECRGETKDATRRTGVGRQRTSRYGICQSVGWRKEVQRRQEGEEEWQSAGSSMSDMVSMRSQGGHMNRQKKG